MTRIQWRAATGVVARFVFGRSKRCTLLGTVLLIFAAMALGAAAGLNAFVPVVLLGVLAKVGQVVLGWPLAGMSDAVLFGVFASLAMVQFFVDKVPALVRGSERVQVVLRPVSAAAVTVALCGPAGLGMWGAGGALAVLSAATALLVHVGMGRLRPLLSEATLGIGPPVMSVAGNLVSVVLTITAAIVPVVSLAFLGVCGYVFVKAYGWSRKRCDVRAANGSEAAVPVVAVAVGSGRGAGHSHGEAGDGAAEQGVGPVAQKKPGSVPG